MIDFGFGEELNTSVLNEIKKKYPLISGETVVHNSNDKSDYRKETGDTFTIVLDNMISFYLKANEKVNILYGYRWLYEPNTSRNVDVLCYKIELVPF